MEPLFLLCILVLLGVNVWISERGRAERQQLYNRLMARDLADYRQMIQKPKPPRENFLTKQMKQGYGGFTDDEDNE